MPRYLLDTDTIIYIRRRRSPGVLDRFKRLEPGEAALSIISFGELWYGAQKSAERDAAAAKLEELVRLIPVMPLPIEARSVYGVARAALERSGTMIGSNDLWIAAHAIAADLILVTNNEREFRRVTDLRIENWTT